MVISQHAENFEKVGIFVSVLHRLSGPDVATGFRDDYVKRYGAEMYPLFSRKYLEKALMQCAVGLLSCNETITIQEYA
jgi:hypothetical protein